MHWRTESWNYATSRSITCYHEILPWYRKSPGRDVCRDHPAKTQATTKATFLGMSSDSGEGAFAGRTKAPNELRKKTIQENLM